MLNATTHLLCFAVSARTTPAFDQNRLGHGPRRPSLQKISAFVRSRPVRRLRVVNSSVGRPINLLPMQPPRLPR